MIIIIIQWPKDGQETSIKNQTTMNVVAHIGTPYHYALYFYAQRKFCVGRLPMLAEEENIVMQFQNSDYRLNCLVFKMKFTNIQHVLHQTMQKILRMKKKTAKKCKNRTLDGQCR